MAAELPRPGVEVLQVFRSVSPSVITPTLVPNVTGVAKQIVDLTVSDGAGGAILNPDALVQLPAFFVSAQASGDPPVYGGLDGLALELELNGGLPVTVNFVDATSSGITPASAVSQIQKDFRAAGVTAALAETVGEDETQFQVRTIGTGPFQTIYVGAGTDPAVAAAFGIGIGKTYTGVSSYDQYVEVVPHASFPDPRHNIAELGIELSSIRAFLSLGSASGVRESLRNSSFLRNGEVNDPGVVTGTVDVTTLTLPADLNTLTVVLKVDAGSVQTITFASPANPAAVVSQSNTQTTGLVASLTAGTNHLRFTSDSLGVDASIEIVSGTALSDLGLTVGVYSGKNIAVIDDGDGNTLSPLVKFTGESFTATPTSATITASTPVGSLPADGTTLILSDGQQPQTVVFDGVAAFADILTQVNAVVGVGAGGRILATGSGTLTLTSTLDGTDSIIHILGGTALASLDPGGSPTLVAGTYLPTAASKPAAGDEVWIDGLFVGIVRSVAPGGAIDTLRLDRMLTVTVNKGTSFYLVAKGLPSADPARPVPDLIIGSDGSAILKQDQLRDTQGNPVPTAAPLYLSYTAVRRDVTSRARNPGLLVFDNTTQLADTLSPVSAANPLALGIYFALVNGAGVQVSGLGVDEISADSPLGTVEAFVRAAEYLEGKEIYATTPLTHDATVHQVWKVHAEAMSAPAAKGERVAVVNQPYPTTKLDSLVASNTDGNTTSGTTFNTGVSNLTALVLNTGISPVGTISVSKGLFLDVAADSKHYSVESISGSIVTIRTAFSPGENDDNFYSTDALPTLIQQAFAIRIRGAALVTASGDPDNNGIAETIAAIGQAYGSRRLWMVLPDQAAATINGLETLIDGFYTTAAICGLIGAQPPQQSFTNFPMAGFTRVIGSQDRFNNRQLDRMAGGGAYILVQDAPGAPVIARQALTTDVTSIETRTDSITKVVDFTAKLLRRSLRNYIGRFNITQGFLDSLGSVINGIGGFLVESGVLVGFTLNNIVQDEDAPDTVLVDVTLDVPYPCNFIRLTLVV